MFPLLKPFSRKRAFTMIEVVMTSAMLILLSLVTIGGMIAHARMAKSNMAFQRMAEQARVLTDGIQINSMDATLIRLDNGPGGTNSVVTFGRPDPTNPSNTLFVQYAFLNGDKKHLSRV